MPSKKKNKTTIILIGILVLLVLVVSLSGLGYFGVKTMRWTKLRMSAREAFEAKDWKNAEKYLTEYLRLDPDSEEDYVRLAQVYRHFGDSDREMQCWHRAAALNPLKPEYWDAYVESAMKARDFQHLYATLSRKFHLSMELPRKDSVLYLICAVMTDHGRDAEKYYDGMLKADQEAFRQDDLARYAQFLITLNTLTENERSVFIEQGTRSDDSFVRLESILFYLGALRASGRDTDSIDEQMVTMLKKAADLNRYAGTPYLAQYHFSRLRFSSVIEVLEPYLEDIENFRMSILYAESCVYGAQPEKLKRLADRYRTRDARHRLLASYFDALYIFCQETEKNDELAGLMQKAGGIVQTALANLIELEIALNNDNPEKICSATEKIMKHQPFYDVQERARAAVRQYLLNRIDKEPAFADDPRVAKLAQLLSAPDNKDPFLMRLTIADLHRRNLLTRQIIAETLEAFPFDPYLLQMAAEFELFNGNPERCLEYTELFYGIKDETTASTAFDLLHVLALELSGKIDEAAKEYADFVDKAEMNLGILYRFFEFCAKYERRAELSKMAERMNSASSVPELKALAPFFQAEELFLQGKEEEAFSLLETAKTDRTDFMLYAADKFGSSGRLDQALSRYLALVDKHPDQRVVLANIAEIQMAMGMKEEAVSYAKRVWEMNPNDGLSQFVYAQMLAVNGHYQDAEKVLKIPNHAIELPDEVRKLWSDIMLHCVREDIANRSFSHALERAKHYLIFFPDDATFQEFKTRSEQELKKKASDSERSEQ